MWAMRFGTLRFYDHGRASNQITYFAVTMGSSFLLDQTSCTLRIGPLAADISSNVYNHGQGPVTIDLGVPIYGRRIPFEPFGVYTK